MSNDRLSNLIVIQKALSKNDTGETGGHQAGILIPKKQELLSFFPFLSQDEKNPRVRLVFIDPFDSAWHFTYIYYNNKFFGGTRNEYRLTGMSRYMKENHIVAPDTLILKKNIGGSYFIEFTKESEGLTTSSGVLILSDSWSVVKI